MSDKDDQKTSPDGFSYGHSGSTKEDAKPKKKKKGKSAKGDGR